MLLGQQKLPSWAKHLDFTIIDLACLAGAFVIAYWAKFGNLDFVDSAMWKGLLAFLLLANLAITLATGPYSGVFRRTYYEDLGAYLKLALWSFLAACVAFYLLKIGEDYSREMLLTTYLAYLAVSLLVKAAWKRHLLARRAEPPADSVRRVVLAAEPGKAVDTEALLLGGDMRSIEVVGFCFIEVEGESEFDGRPVTGPTGAAELAARTDADEILVACDPALIGADALEVLIEDGVRVRFAIAESLGVVSENQSLSRAGALKTLDLERYSFGAGQLLYLPVKRSFDIVFGVVGCVVACIAAVFVKVAYLADGDRHPIVYTQRRVGLRGRQFDLYKFRSMVWDADEVLEDLLRDPTRRAEWDREQKLADDPRVTPVGRFLRKTSVDEFPQFLNVLKGDMSVVGPRPLVPGELEEHGGRPLYNKVRPGITGWWGCNGRSNINYRERLELEYHYVRHCSLYLDVLCVVRTVAAVLKREGAR